MHLLFVPQHEWIKFPTIFAMGFWLSKLNTDTRFCLVNFIGKLSKEKIVCILCKYIVHIKKSGMKVSAWRQCYFSFFIKSIGPIWELYRKSHRFYFRNFEQIGWFVAFCGGNAENIVVIMSELLDLCHRVGDRNLSKCHCVCLFLFFIAIITIISMWDFIDYSLVINIDVLSGLNTINISRSCYSSKIIVNVRFIILIPAFLCYLGSYSTVVIVNCIVASELKDPICHSDECQIGSFSSEATVWSMTTSVYSECISLSFCSATNTLFTFRVWYW